MIKQGVRKFCIFYHLDVSNVHLKNSPLASKLSKLPNGLIRIRFARNKLYFPLYFKISRWLRYWAYCKTPEAISLELTRRRFWLFCRLSSQINRTNGKKRDINATNEVLFYFEVFVQPEKQNWKIYNPACSKFVYKTCGRLGWLSSFSTNIDQAFKSTELLIFFHFWIQLERNNKKNKLILFQLQKYVVQGDLGV